MMQKGFVRFRRAWVFFILLWHLFGIWVNIPALVVFLSPFASWALSLVFEPVRQYVPVISAFAIGAFVATLVPITSYLRKGSFSWLLQGYRIIEVEHAYRISNDEPSKHTATAIKTIEARRWGVNLVEFRYLWTGTGKVDTTVTSPGHNLLMPSGRKLGWNVYYIDLGETLPRGGRARIEVEQRLTDSDQTFESFLA